MSAVCEALAQEAYVRCRDWENIITLCLHDVLAHEKTELTSHRLKPWIRFAPKTAHGCMIGIESIDLFSTLIANCGVIPIYDLSKLWLTFKTRLSLD